MQKRFQKPVLTVSELSRALYDANQKLHQANEQLSETNQKLQDANQALITDQKSRMHFYSNTSHDLRAPITAISNFTEYLLSQFTLDAAGKQTFTGDSEEMHRILTHIHSRADYMKYLINDIFLLSSLESSDARLKLEPISVGFFLEDFFYMCEEDAYYNKVELHLDLPEDFDCTMNWDPELMRRVLDNLFTNAVKYSSKHPMITLGAYIGRNTNSGQTSIAECNAKDNPEEPSITNRNVDDTAGQLHIYVEDNGIGISTENLQHIFERSFQADHARTPKADAGVGLGLSIVKSIVELHHGTIICESMLHKGSRLTMSFPLEQS